MKIRGWRKLEKRLNKLVNLIEGNIKVEIGSLDESVISKRKIYFQIMRNIGMDKFFMNYLAKVYPDAPKLSPYMYTLLHELGHFNTKEILDNEDKAIREYLMKSGDNDKYFALPAEKAATNWAVGYAVNNSFFIKEIDRQIEKAMVKFISKNVTE